MKTSPKTTTRHFKTLPQNKPHVSQELKPVVERSDKRIRDAIESLQATHRGRQALSDFKAMAQGDASGLDMSGMAALVVLVREFAFGRRDFLAKIESKPDEEKSKLREACSSALHHIEGRDLDWTVVRLGPELCLGNMIRRALGRPEERP